MISVLKSTKRLFEVNSKRHFLKSIFIYSLLIVYQPLAMAEVLLDANWEKGVINDFYFNISKNDYGAKIIDGSVTNEPVCTGKKSLKSELIYGKGTTWSQLVLNEAPFNSFDYARHTREIGYPFCFS